MTSQTYVELWPKSEIRSYDVDLLVADNDEIINIVAGNKLMI